jgi:hypothetical protein
MSAGIIGGGTLGSVGGMDSPSRVMGSECRRATSRRPNSQSFWIWYMKPGQCGSHGVHARGGAWRPAAGHHAHMPRWGRGHGRSWSMGSRQSTGGGGEEVCVDWATQCAGRTLTNDEGFVHVWVDLHQVHEMLQSQ